MDSGILTALMALAFVVIIIIAILLIFLPKAHAYLAYCDTPAGNVNGSSCYARFVTPEDEGEYQDDGEFIPANNNTFPVVTPPVIDPLWAGIGVPDRLQKMQENVSMTGTVVGVKPHWAPDGDMVFALRPDPPNDVLVNEHNKAQEKMAGGIWIEGICQKPNKSTAVYHVGDCMKGGPFPHFELPELGDHLWISGTYVLDIREGGHAEVHPLSKMVKIP